MIIISVSFDISGFSSMFGSLPRETPASEYLLGTKVIDLVFILNVEAN